MKQLAFILSLSLLTLPCVGRVLTFNDYADIIGKIENSTKYPYGIKSVSVVSSNDARRICIMTVSNSFVRWTVSGKHGHFVSYLASTYCPQKSDHQGNKNWKHNFNYFAARILKSDVWAKNWPNKGPKIGQGAR